MSTSSQTSYSSMLQKKPQPVPAKIQSASDRLARLVVNRANYVKRKAKNCTGSSGKQKFLQQMWQLTVLEAEVSRTPSHQKARVLTRSLGKRSDRPYSKRHEQRLKKQRIANCTSALSFLGNDGLVPSKLTLKKAENVSPQNSLTITLDLDGSEEISQSQEELITMMLYVKDKYHISGQAYHEMASLCKQMPRHYKLKQKITELNSLWNIFPAPEGTSGVQQCLEERLRICLERMIDHAAHHSTSDSSLFADNSVRVKLTGDGTKLGKHLHVVNFAFTILEEGSKAHSPAGNHCIAILKEGEDYESLRKGLQDIVQQVKDLNSITIRDRTMNISYYLGGDWKFLAMVTGIGAATSTYGCIWCKCPALERHDSSQTWSIFDKDKGARSIEENIMLAKSRRKDKYNVINEPIFPMIPLDRVVVDNLHMFLRVSDTLIDLLLLELKRLDSIDKATKVKSLDSLNYLKLYQSTLKMIGISGFEFWIGKESHKLKYRTLTGPEKLLLFSKLNITETFPQVPMCAQVQALWNDLLAINRILSAKPHEINTSLLSKFETDSKQFVQSFVIIYPSKFVTPYMHCMVQHVSEFFDAHGSILQFTQQGLEKYNDLMTKDYFRSSSHRGVECLQQILQKQNRLEHLEHLGAKRTPATIHCTKCGAEGHNRKTCQNLPQDT